MRSQLHSSSPVCCSSHRLHFPSQNKRNRCVTSCILPSLKRVLTALNTSSCLYHLSEDSLYPRTSSKHFALRRCLPLLLIRKLKTKGALPLLVLRRLWTENSLQQEWAMVCKQYVRHPATLCSQFYEQTITSLKQESGTQPEPHI